MRLFVGKQTPEHKGDTSRELVDMWEESGYLEVIRDEVDDVFLWLNEPNDILLYEYDRFDVYPHLPKNWKRGLFGGMQNDDPRASSWIYWSRHPRKLEQKINDGIVDLKDRDIESVFLGKIENHIQFTNRSKYEWSEVVEMFSLPAIYGRTGKWPYTQDEYLDILAHSKFGLCLAGYGPKCNREIEYIGLGVVPIVAPEVDMTYYDPLSEGNHYFRCANPDEFKKIVESVSDDRWIEMSNNCREWYERNCSREGSFKTTERIMKSWVR